MANKKLSTLFGPVLRQFRNSKNVTQEELAARLGIASPYISRLESGHKHPSLEMVFRLAKALEIKPSDIVLAVEERLK